MRIFKTRTFQRWAVTTGSADASLLEAVKEMEGGLIHARLGGNLFKQRVSLPGRGKSGSARTLIVTQFADVWYFLYGFEKNERDNMTDRELRLYQKLASELLALTEDQIIKALAAQNLLEL
ncbi:MAG: type II toxin-antitoxin system RelE/ParE family toxin [Rhodoferax sp.]|jgi:hypothetical protein|nr:type II toxin-antitoxin system RelE/ParE family toxin [Rhodoferax sp.]